MSNGDSRGTDKKKIVIVYASQTGQSKIIAETLNDSALENGFEPTLFDIAQHGKEFNFNELVDPLVFVCSTTGDGETPESARKCWHKLKRINKDAEPTYLGNLNYALLGLGDSNYSQFCNGPKLFHARFQDLGARCFYGPVWADDGVGLEIEVEPFKDGLWDALDDFFNQNEADLTSKMHKLALTDHQLGFELTLPELVENHLAVEYSESPCEEEESPPSNLLKIFSAIYPQSASNIYAASVVESKIMTGKDAEKLCFDVKFKPTKCYTNTAEELAQFEFKYEPGHAIDIVTHNDQTETDRLLERLDLKNVRNKKLHIKLLNPTKKLGIVYSKLSESTHLTLDLLFKYCVDVRTNGLKKNFLRMLAEYCSEENERMRLLQLASKEGSEQYQTLVKESSLTLLDLLNIFKSCRPPVDYLIQMLPPLNTRSYTLCSDGSSSNEMEIIFNLVNFKKDDHRTYDRLGVATGYLSRLHKDDTFYFLNRKFQNFAFPADTKPIIMIGPGTGIAPFISYLRSLANDKSEQRNLWLFVGCRDPAKDFLFGKELVDERVPLLTKLSVSFSRTKLDNEQDPLFKHYVKDSKYVQDSLKHYAKEVASLLHDLDAYVYVCGDAKNMSKDVFNCFVDICVKELNMSTEQANKYLMDMIKNKRYKQDIWA